MDSTGGRMSLAVALAWDVPERTRTKGRSYFADGAVTSLEQHKDSVAAIVRGTNRYHVTLTRERDGFIATCECPFFEDRLEVCKHVWAVILATDSRGWLPPVSETAWLDARDPYFDDWEFRESSGPQPPARPERWQLFLSEIARAAEAPDDIAPSAHLHAAQLIYAISLQAAPSANGIPILVLSRHRKKNGEWTQPQTFSLQHEAVAELQDPDDREILPLLLGAADPYGTAYQYSYPVSGNFLLRGPLLHTLLPRIARTGRLHLRTAIGTRQEHTPLGWDDGPAWRLRVEVKGEDDIFVVDGVLVRDDQRMPLTEPQFLFRTGFLIAGSTLARFDPQGAFPIVTELRRGGRLTVPRAAAPQLVAPLASLGVDPSALPDELRYHVLESPPHPCASIARVNTGYRNYADLNVTVTFEYDGTRVPPDMRPATYDPARQRLIKRDRAAEGIALDRLQQVGVRRLPAGHDRREFVVNVNAFPAVVRTLVNDGWRVEAEGRMFRAPGAMQASIKSGVDWFELHGSVDYGDGRRASIADLLASLRRGDGSVVLDDGSRGMLPEQWLQKYLRIASFGETTDGHVRFRPTQTALLDALLEAQPAISTDETFARARAQLREFTGIRPVNPPRSFKGTLREYQREALGWFGFLREFGFGGCLADDMGLGKTVMVLALLESRRTAPEGEALPTLAVVPRSLVFNWKDEAARFAPKLRVLDYTGASRELANLAEHDLVLTTYGTLRRDAAVLTQQPFDYVILDEAQAIKNPATAAAKAARLLRGRHRLALSGTPIENHVGELWSLFEFLNPGMLGSATSFKKVSSATTSAPDDLAVVTRAVRPMILRRTKAQVEPQLPARTEQTIVCELEGPQRKFYDRLRDHYRGTLMATVARTGMARSKLRVLEALLRLRQAACHTGLVDPSRLNESSAKLDALLPQLLEVTGEGHKALVFSQFTSFLSIVRERLHDAGLVYEYLDGETKDRGERVHHFNTDPDCRVFLISLKAGGVGLNLTSAEYVFLLDPWWNPAAEAQAIDRAHRIGQARHVFAYRLIARNTVEEKVAELQGRKRELADAILTADPALIRTLTADDLDWLLG